MSVAYELGEGLRAMERAQAIARLRDEGRSPVAKGGEAWSDERARAEALAQLDAVIAIATKAKAAFR
jgi:hypothetical protein